MKPSTSRERITPDQDKIDDAVLLLLGLHDAYGSVWKSHNWDALDRAPYDRREVGLGDNAQAGAKPLEVPIGSH